MNQIVKVRKTIDAIIVYTKGQLMKKEREEIEANYRARGMMIFYRSILDGKPA